MSAEAFKPSHQVLFEAPKPTAPRKPEELCDVCGELVALDDDGYPAGGRGMYLWTRGDEIRFEEPSLCGSCGTAIGVIALAQWDVEEEEG
jgi:hypothetical protein